MYFLPPLSHSFPFNFDHTLTAPQIFVTVYAPRGAVCRIISLRKANARETERYHASQD